VLKAIYHNKDKWSNVGRFPRKGGGSLGSLKYQAFPSQILSFKTFTKLSLSNSLRIKNENTILCKNNNEKQENTQLKNCYLESFKLDVS